MKKNILYAAAAGICGAVLLGGGILIGKSLQPPPEKPVELELLFDLDGMRAAAECVTDFCLQKAMRVPCVSCILAGSGAESRNR